jgi:hypothetical protein
MTARKPRPTPLASRLLTPARRAARPGRQMPKAVGVKIRIGKRRRRISALTRAKLSAALTGRSLSANHRAKISLAHRGKILSPAHRAKLSLAHRGKTVPPVTRAKIGATQKGRKKSAAHRAKISAALQGHTVTAATRAKISAAHQGKTLSAAHRQKIGQAVRGEGHGNYRHGLYAAPPYPIRTINDLYRWRGERQIRLSGLLDQLPTGSPAELNHWANLYVRYSQNASKLARHLRDQPTDQADEAAAEAVLAEWLGEEWEKMLKEEEDANAAEGAGG